MKSQRFAIAIAVLPLLLSACNQPMASQSGTAPHPLKERDSGTMPAPPPIPEWRAFGNEPFWSVRVVGNHLMFSTPENPAGVNLTAKHSLPGGADHFDSMDGSNGFDLEIYRQSCSDGMSDRQYELTSRFRYGEVKYKGCAERLR